MDLILRRMKWSSDGVFSDLLDENNNQICLAGEHAYSDVDDGVQPKIPMGTYLCVRGEHQLEGMSAPFTTFEISDVPGHTNILFHAGNFPQIDSAGCVLLGEAIEQINGVLGVSNSRATFESFMAMQDGVDSFTLLVE